PPEELPAFRVEGVDVTAGGLGAGDADVDDAVVEGRDGRALEPRFTEGDQVAPHFFAGLHVDPDDFPGVGLEKHLAFTDGEALDPGRRLGAVFFFADFGFPFPQLLAGGGVDGD